MPFFASFTQPATNPCPEMQDFYAYLALIYKALRVFSIFWKMMNVFTGARGLRYHFPKLKITLIFTLTPVLSRVSACFIYRKSIWKMLAPYLRGFSRLCPSSVDNKIFLSIYILLHRLNSCKKIAAGLLFCFPAAVVLGFFRYRFFWDCIAWCCSRRKSSHCHRS